MSGAAQTSARDIVENRSKLSTAAKLQLLYLSLRENGLRWTSALVGYYVFSAISERVFAYVQRSKVNRGLPGTSSPRMNELIWTTWDWSTAGEEWTPSEAWKKSLIVCVLVRYIPANSVVLEIGPGAGRWTEALLPRSKQLIGVDISESCIEICRRKFAAASNATFLKTLGSELSGIPDRSIDAVWSFDVFVHINQREAAAYIEEFARVWRPGAIGVIHHGSGAGIHGGWRSDLTSESFARLLMKHGFAILDQFQNWEDGNATHSVGLYRDVITVFDAPHCFPGR